MRKLKLLMAICALLIGGGNLANAYQTPVANGIYYLYNTGVTDGGSGFICRGENYAQRAVIDKYGIPFKLISTGEDDTYYFQLYDTDLWLSDDGFMYTDGGTDRRRAIKVVLQSDGIYKLINTNNENKEVENWYGHPVGDGTGNRRDYLWQFLSVAEYEAVVAGYTATEKSSIASAMSWDLSGTNFDSYLSTNYVGVDKTSLIEHATFDTGHSTTGWTVTQNANSSMAIAWGNEGGDKITPEVYQGYGTISQTVTVPNAGLYKVSVNAFVRNNNYTRFHEAGAVSSVSYLQANDNKVRLCDIYSNGEVTSGFPGGPNAANTNFFLQGKYLNEVYVYVDDSKTITITLCNPSATGGCWMVFNNFKLTYYSDEVSDDDATAILATATEKESKAMLASVKSALTSAKTTFDGARTIANYNALNTAIDNANSSITAYAPLGTKLTEAASVKSSVSSNSPSYVTTFDTNIAAITSDYNAGNYAESEIPTQVAAVETEIVTLVKSQTVSGSDMTRVVPNAACTAAAGADNWKIENALASGEYFRLDTWAGSAAGMSVPMIEYWITNGNNLSTNKISQTITGLQKGIYTVTATTAVNNESKTAPTAGSALLFANDETKDITSGGTETSFKGQTGTFSVSVEITDADNGELELGLKAVSPNYNWIAFKNVTLTYYGAVAGEADYTALTAAINAAEGKTLGFENGEYAPYNNVDALEALAAAKAIDQGATNAKTVVNNATTALTGATWTANVGEVNAIYWEDYTSGDIAGDYIHPLGWTNTGYNTRIYSDAAGNKGTNTGISAVSNLAMMMKYNTTYGETTGYTMPLKANTIYKITFKYCGWGNNPTTNIVLTDPSDNTISLAPGFKPATNDGNSNAEHWYDYTGYFVSTTAGNYVLAMNKVESGQQQIGIGDIGLVSATELPFADGSVPTYAPGTYPTVKISRTLTAGRWATAVYPFAVSGVDNIAVIDSYDKTTGALDFTSATTTTANVPFLMRSTAGITELSLNDVAVAAASATDATADEASLKGVYTSTNITNTAKNFVLSNNMIYAVGEAGATIKPYRAYIQIEQDAAPARLTFTIDGNETTGIDFTPVLSKDKGTIFNLQGQEVKTVKKGLYIQNGKKIVIK